MVTMDRLDLYFGDDLILFDKLIIKHPKLIDIKKLGYQKYMQYISNLILSPKDIADILWFESQQWYEDISHWTFFIQMYMNETSYKDALKWFTGYEFYVMTDKDNNLFLADIEKKIIINEFTFMVLLDFIKQINFIPNKIDLDNCGNKHTKIYLLKQMYKKRKKNTKEKIDLASIISAVDWKSSKGNEIWNFSIYRIYEGYFRLNQIDNYDKTMMGLYFGTIDTSKNPIDFEKINWSNIINL